MEDQATETVEVVEAPPIVEVQPVVQSKRSALSWGLDILVAVVVSMFIIFFLYQPVHVEGTSMQPVLEDQDRLLINKFAYSWAGSLVGEDIHRGDIVVFKYPYDTTKSYIKRVIAVPGDILRIDHGQVYVNDKPLKEPYVPAKYTDERSAPEMVLGHGKYFMMGDHRLISQDSREFGPVSRNLIYGKAAFVFWPVDQAGVVK